MSIERAREYLKQYNMEDRILEFDVSSATVELAAQALHCEPKRIAKTLSFKVGDGRDSHCGGGRRQGKQRKVQGAVWHEGQNALAGRSGNTGGTRRGRRLPVWHQ